MQRIKLTERIRYIHCNDDEGNHGVLVLLGNERFPTVHTQEVNDRDDFRLGFNNLKVTEDTQNELLTPLQVQELITA